MRQKDIFLRKWKDQQIAQSELDRKWRLQLEAQNEELMMAEQAVYLASLNPMNALHVVGGGMTSALIDIGTLQITVVSVEMMQTSDWCFTASAPTTFSVNWGDGIIEEYPGDQCIRHTYAEAGTWNAVITFADPALITNINFNAN